MHSNHPRAKRGCFVFITSATNATLTCLLQVVPSLFCAARLTSKAYRALPCDVTVIICA